jgi:hypothetical protein
LASPETSRPHIECRRAIRQRGCALANRRDRHAGAATRFSLSRRRDAASVLRVNAFLTNCRLADGRLVDIGIGRTGF